MFKLAAYTCSGECILTSVSINVGGQLLGYYSVWPFFLEIGILMAIVSTPLFRAADSPPITASTRVESFDGLRGFLALSVFFHHSAVYQQYLHYGIWGNHPLNSTRFWRSEALPCFS